MLNVILLSVIMLSVSMLSVITLSVIILSVIMFSVIMLIVIMLIVIMLIVIMLIVIMLIVIMQYVMAPNLFFNSILHNFFQCNLQIYTCKQVQNQPLWCMALKKVCMSYTQVFKMVTRIIQPSLSHTDSDYIKNVLQH